MMVSKVNERMLESYIYARDRFLKPNGKMFPSLGRIHIAAFTDPVLHSELLGKAMFWTSPNFYGVDLTSLHSPATRSFFNQVDSQSNLGISTSLSGCLLDSSCRVLLSVPLTTIACLGVQVVIDAFDPGLLVSHTNSHVIDFMTATENDLLDIHIPLDLKAGAVTLREGKPFPAKFHGKLTCGSADVLQQEQAA